MDAACVSSLAAVGVACESLWDGDCALALCGGGDRSLRAQRFETLSLAGCLSHRGRCAPFEEEADGFLPAEGAGLLVLERLSDALAAGRRVLAVVRSVGSASDGRWQDPFVPSPDGLRLAMRRAYETAGVERDRIAFVEAHGDGTPARDQAEAEALRSVLARGREGPALGGSVKANIGHAQGAAGAASLIKAALALRHREVPPQPGGSAPSSALGCELELSQRCARCLPPRRRLRACRRWGWAAPAGVVLATAPPSAVRARREDGHTDRARAHGPARPDAPSAGGHPRG